ncbi:MAG TPA: hypothetical protein VFS65_02665 [Candidatus Saccharimonadales bacterium]|nr:hypothetical protein [Candidatus Saccharimonadales bacterium]
MSLTSQHLHGHDLFICLEDLANEHRGIVWRSVSAKPATVEDRSGSIKAQKVIHLGGRLYLSSGGIAIAKRRLLRGKVITMLGHIPLEHYGFNEVFVREAIHRLQCIIEKELADQY